MLHSVEELQQHLDAWDDLASHAVEPNVFYEAWFFLPALKAFAAGQDLLFLLVYQPINAQRRKPVLCGFFPLARRRLHRLLPFRVLELWKHDFCFLTTPLLRAGLHAEAFEQFAHWLHRDRASGCLLYLDTFAGEGPIACLLAQTLHLRGWSTFLVDSYSRAIIRPQGSNAGAYLTHVLTNRRLREVRRKERHLAEEGRLEKHLLESPTELDRWIDDFLAIEASGWKGEAHSAMACNPQNAEFFRTMARGASERGRLQMLALHLNDKPVAMKCNLLSGDGGFAFKIAYDENNASFSPGLLLEIGTIEFLFEKHPVQWMDSCASAEHFMINRLWDGRRLIRTKYIAPGRSPGSLLVALMPLARWFKRTIRYLLGRS
ncbi:MAG: GNAT family N-acetyltransferase [Gemmataceae bacterium]